MALTAYVVSSGGDVFAEYAGDGDAGLNGWHIVDVSSSAKSPGAAGQPFAMTIPTSPAIFYRDVNGHIQELTFSGSTWTALDITHATSATTAANDPTGVVDGSGVLRVDYVGNDSHLHQMWLNGAGQSWNTTDLSSLPTNATVAQAQGIPHHVVSPDGTIRVNYRTTTNGISQIYLPPGANQHWAYFDLSGNLGATLAKGDPGGFVDKSSVTRIDYVATDGDVHQIWLNNGGNAWQTTNLSTLAGVSNSTFSTAVSEVVSNDGTIRIDYRGGDSRSGPRIWQIYLPPGGSWSFFDSNQINGAINATTDPGSMVDDFSETHVTYLAVDGDLHEIALPSGGSWVSTNLTLAGSP